MESGTMIFPEALQPGDTIGIVSPAFPVKTEERDASIRFWESMGFQVKIGTCLEKLYNFYGYLAGDDKSRAEDINRMFADPSVKAILCVRGGYGSAHIMKYLDFELIKKNPKIFVGFSDITNLHSAFQMFCNLVTFHGPMVCSNMISHFDDYTKESFWAALTMGDELEFTNPAAEEGFFVLHEGRASGLITGGNLAVLARGCGTFFQLDTTGKILFLEDVDETIPKLDMSITQMEYAGMFDHIRGILLGDFTDCTNEKYDGTYEIHEFLKERLSAYGVPVMCKVRSGHDRPMGTIPFGTYCTVDTDSKKIVFSR